MPILYRPPSPLIPVWDRWISSSTLQCGQRRASWNARASAEPSGLLGSAFLQRRVEGLTRGVMIDPPSPADLCVAPADSFPHLLPFTLPIAAFRQKKERAVRSVEARNLIICHKVHSSIQQAVLCYCSLQLDPLPFTFKISVLALCPAWQGGAIAPCAHSGPLRLILASHLPLQQLPSYTHGVSGQPTPRPQHQHID